MDNIIPENYSIENLALHNDEVLQGYKIHERIISHRSLYQKIDIVYNKVLGRILLLDDVIQTTYADEFFYHEMMVHIALCAKQNTNSVLIIGAGDGGILREVLKYSSVKKATIVEIDSDVITLSKEYMPDISKGAFEDSRANIIIGDAIDFVRNSDELFDIIIVDSTDNLGVAETLFIDEFYANCSRCLLKDGIFIRLAGVLQYQKREIKKINDNLCNYFDFNTFYSVAVPTYIGGAMQIAFASHADNRFLYTREDIEKYLRDNNIFTLKYYNGDIHYSAFASSNLLKELLN